MISSQVHQRVQECLDQGATLAYWCSDQHGRPANHTPNDPAKWQVKEGLVQEISGKLLLCENALHATLYPHRWRGIRVWLVALWGKVVGEDFKMGALKREILCEIFPEDAIDPSVAIRFVFE